VFFACVAGRAVLHIQSVMAFEGRPVLLHTQIGLLSVRVENALLDNILILPAVENGAHID